VAGLAAALVFGGYYGYAAVRRIAFLESDYADETPREARRRQLRVVAIIVLLVVSLWQTLRLLRGG
jgi:hypothetical protein